jgi:carbamate kinase
MDFITYAKWLQNKLLQLAIYRQDEELQRQVLSINVDQQDDATRHLYVLAISTYLYSAEVTEEEKAHLDLDGDRGWRRARFKYE